MTQDEIIEANNLIAQFMDGRYQEYNMSWGWLMYAVKKICNIDFYSNDIDDNYKMEVYKITQLSISTPIETVWMAVIDFIKWHNQNT